jgi:hypothetical protein
MAVTNAIIVYETGPNPPAIHDWTCSIGNAPYGYGLKLWIHEPDWTLCLGYRYYRVPVAGIWITVAILGLAFVVVLQRLIGRREKRNRPN